MMNLSNHRGFTLIELVATIIVLGIVSVTVAPRFFDRSGFAEYALQDEIISLLRVAKQRAMYDHGGDCYGVALNSSPIQVLRAELLLGDYSLPFDASTDYAGLSVSENNSNNIYFDALGNALAGADCTAASPVSGSTNISISGVQTLTITVHASGYVQRI